MRHAVLEEQCTAPSDFGNRVAASANTICAMRFVATALLMILAIPTLQAGIDFDKLTKGQEVDGFRVNAVYLNDANKPMGAQFVHRPSSFTLDLLRIESRPHAYTWVNS